MLSTPSCNHPMAFSPGPDARPALELTLGARTVTQLLDIVDYGVLLTSGHGELLFANQSGTDWLATRHPLRLQHGTVVASAAGQASAFDHALSSATRKGIQTLLHFESAAGDRCCVSVMPLEAVGEPPIVVLMLGRRNDSQDLGQEAYARRLSLTAAQTRVMKLLCTGAKPPEIADRLGVKLTTVRTHIGALRDKCGTHDTAGIVQQVSLLPPLPRLRHRRFANPTGAATCRFERTAVDVPS